MTFWVAPKCQRLIPLFLVLGLNFFFPSPVIAQRKKIHLEHLTHQQGLSQSLVTAILQDRFGYLWFGTQEGLNRYDGYAFTVYKNDLNSNDSLPNDWVLSIHEDLLGELWVGTNGGGLAHYLRDQDRFERYQHDSQVKSLSLNEVTAIQAVPFEGSQDLFIGTRIGVDQFTGSDEFIHLDLPRIEVAAFAHDPSSQWAQTLFIGSHQGLLIYDLVAHQVKHLITSEHGLSHTHILSLYLDTPYKKLWIGTLNGLNCLDLGNLQVEAVTLPIVPGSEQPGALVRSLHAQSKGALWIGSSEGVFKLDRNAHKIESFYGDKALEVYAIREDQVGVVWIGTMGDSLYRYNLQKERFAHYHHWPDDPNSLSNNLVFSMLEDDRHGIWLTTGAGGVDYWEPDASLYTHFNTDKGENLPQFWALASAGEGRLWLGSANQGLFLFHPERGVEQRYQHDPTQPTSIASNALRSLLVDSQSRLWIGTTAGLDRLAEGRFVHLRFDPKNPDGLGHGNVQHIIEKDNALWLATLGGGLNRYQPDSGHIRQFRHSSRVDSIGSDQVLVIFSDESQGDLLWVGTLGGGFGKLRISEGTFTNYTTAHGLPNNVVYDIQADAKNCLWMSTNRGLARFDPQTETFTNYSAQDGIQGPEFAQTSSIAAQSGLFYFGGNNGITVFDPLRVDTQEKIPLIQLTNFFIFNQPVDGKHQQANSPLKGPIWSTHEIQLNHTMNMVSFEFAALNAAAPNAVKYSYKLDGLHSDWIETTAQNRLAVFTNLNAGTYVLQVKAKTPLSEWRLLEHPLTLMMSPPPWKSWWAICLYGLTGLGLLTAYVRTQRKELAFERAEKERQNAINERLRQVDTFKDEILANTSHELRTPLHGIIGLADSLRDGSVGELPPRAIRNLDMIISSGKRLTSLVNDILDFSKLKTKKLELQKNPVDLYTLTEMVLSLSKPLLANKDLELINAIPPSFPSVKADENRLQQVLHNLVGNAIKFTQAGFVKVAARVEREEDRLYIEVIDTGVGIPESKIETIFNAFEQADTTAIRSYGGTGLGLAITKQLVALHGGSIIVNSVLNKGSIFSFFLPLSDLEGDSREVALETGARVHVYSAEEVLTYQDFNLTLDADPVNLEPEWRNANGEIQQSRILVVDDEPINRQVLFNYLAPLGYRLSEAGNGFSALEIVATQQFDLILLDIMMPRMSGYEVCTELRKTHHASELPIIFLTARNQTQDLVQGFSSGANDYLTKPITRSELIARVRTHIKLLHFHRSLEAKVSERTRELQQKNQELDARYFELETFSSIMRALKGIVSLDKIADLLLEHGLVLFPWAKSAAFLSFDASCQSHILLASRDLSPDQFAGYASTKETIETLSGHRATKDQKIADGVYLLVPPITGNANGNNAANPTNFQISLSIPQGNQPNGLVVFEGLCKEGLPVIDEAKISRYREHVANAVARVHVTRETG